VIEAQGKATAEAMRVKAESFKQYNEAGVIEMIVRILPDVPGKQQRTVSPRPRSMVITTEGTAFGRAARAKLNGRQWTGTSFSTIAARVM